MHKQHRFLWMGLVFAALSGCVSGGMRRPPTLPAASAWQDSMTAMNGYVRRTLDAVTPEQHPVLPPWDWVTAIPTATARAELLTPTISAEQLAVVVPDRPRSTIAAVAYGSSEICTVAEVDRKPVNNCSQLNALADMAMKKAKPVRVRFEKAGGTDSDEPPELELAPTELLALSQAVAHDQPVYRVSEDGNLWVVLRQAGVRTKVLARVERSCGVVQVLVTLGVCWGPPALLPVELRAAADGQPLRCLTAAETLQALHGNAQSLPSASEQPCFAFSTVSERADYLIPTNYKRLEELTRESERSGAGPRRQPALISVPGVAYPGPAVLGDARALCGTLLQREPLRPGQPERTGWIMFAGVDASRAKTLEISIDVGKGPATLRFKLPER